MTLRRMLPADPAHVLRAMVTLALLALSAAVAPVRLPVLVALALGTAVASTRDFAFACPN
jgi:hypothetical protein